MSHRIIISSRATSEEQPLPVEVTVEYAPPHDMSPADVGNEVARILRHMKRMQDGDES